MNFEKAHKELQEGKKIRRKSWEYFMHIRKIDGKIKTYKGEYTNFYEDANVLISDGWVIVDGDGKELSFIEALEALKIKKHIMHKDWIENKLDQFVFVDQEQIAICKAVQFDFMPSLKCLCALDWETIK
jgi:hypothetical protein